MKCREQRKRVMNDARKRYKDGERLQLGWTFKQCLSTAWQAEKLREQYKEQAEALKK